MLKPKSTSGAAACPLCYEAARQFLTDGVQLDSAESAVLAVTSIAVGTALGLMMAFNVVDDASRQGNYGSVAYSVPWTTLIVVFVIVLAVALGTTYLPARRASRVYAAEALRYE